MTGSPLVQDGRGSRHHCGRPHGVKLRYTIEDGIPLLLPPELLPAAAAAPAFQHDAGQPRARPAGSGQPDAARAGAHAAG